MADKFHIGVSSDFRTDVPGALEPVLARILDPLPYVTWDYYDSPPDRAVSPAAIADCDGVIVLASHFRAESFTGNDRPAVIARWGVGYDRIDTAAATANDVLLAITVDAVRRPVAEAIVTLLLALAKKLPAKDRLVRTGRWDLKAQTFGLGLTGKTLGSVGVGNIGGEMFRLFAPFDFGRRIAYDPYTSPERAAALGVELVDLETVFRESDFVTVNCPLTPETHGIVNRERLALMKPTAFLINTARGPIVNQADLTAALQAGQIAGAGLDVFEEEPLDVNHPLTQMENVILSPHALAWTDELYQLNGELACENVLAVLRGETPRWPVNREVLARPGYQAKLAALQARWRELTG